MDLVTFGEAMLRFTPPGFQRLEQARTLDVHVGGAELNAAIAAARLGLATRWVSRLPDNAVGRTIASHARTHGVDVSHVVWADGERAGLYFTEAGAAPRAAEVLYDRANSAMSRATPDTFDWSRALSGARWFHTSGITPAISDSAAATAAQALATAKKAGLTVSYDLNYRGKLWTPDRARAVQEPLMRHIDVLVASDETARLVFGVGGDTPERVARELRERLGVKTVAVTRREAPRSWSNSWTALVLAEDTVHCAPTYEIEVVDPIGAGDAFSGGLIYGFMRHGSWDAAVRYGTAVAALKHTTSGDASLARLDDVEHVLEGKTLRVRR